MKIIFFGSGTFAVRILEAVYRAGHDVSLVVTQPDRKKGRHLRLAPTPVKEYALSRGLPLFQPENINSGGSQEALLAPGADIFLVVSYGRILSGPILLIPKKMCLNIHASLLPKYRGAAPINWALIDGESKTGVSFIKMNRFMDKGDIIFQESITIDPFENCSSLEEKLARLAASRIDPELEKIGNNQAPARKQDDRLASRAPRLKKEDGLIHWERTAAEIFNRFRGCSGWPGTWTLFSGKMLKILRLELLRAEEIFGRPGEITKAEDDYLEVACGAGKILIQEVLPESHKRMSAQSFLSGHRIGPGDMLGQIKKP